MLIDVNWGNFQAKFNGREQVAFERFCYLLFCREFDKGIGIFRFKNHAGIETDPIEKDGMVIGWQAKFYTTPLSKHKNDFIDAINKAQARHPKITKIIFYTNQEFGQNQKKKTDPQYKIDIETHARSKGIEIDWRQESYFESPFVCEQNYSIAEHFFSLKKGILDSITAMQEYTDSILKPIRSEIFFNGNTIKLDRSVIVTSITDTVRDSPLVILSGGAGVGKTAVIKDLYDVVQETVPLFVFKATQFESISHINQIFKDYGEITSSEFIEEHKDIPKKYVVFDSAERLAEIEDQDVFRVFLSDLVGSGWSVIFTVRHVYLDDLRFQLKEFYGANFASLNIPNLQVNEVEKISKDYDFLVPQNERLANLLLVPLYLSVYLQNYAEIKENISYPDFRNIIWRKHIQNTNYQSKNLHRRREGCFLKIARQRANEGGFFVKTDELDHEALQKLESDEIIKYDDRVGGYFITHDVYEEWALDMIIERAFTGVRNYHDFYKDIGASLPVRRAFRGWLSDKLFANDENAKKLIEFTIQNDDVENNWKDEVIVSSLLSDYSETFFERFEEALLQEHKRTVAVEGSSETTKAVTANYKLEKMLLYRVVFLLRIACKTVDENLLNLLKLTRLDAISFKTIFTTPKGSGWSSAIDFINKHKEKLQLRYMNAILVMLDDWNSVHREGETTKGASQIALFYYNTLTAQEGFYFGSRDNTKDKLLRIILNGSGEIKTELTQIIDQIIADGDTTHRSRYYELVQAILSSINDSAVVAKHLPKEVIKLANLFWFYTPPEDTYPYPNYRNDLEQYFGLVEGHLEYDPSSAFQTPIFTLLQTAPQETVDFILSFTNKSIEYFSQSRLGSEAEQIDVVIGNSGTTIKQYIGHRIWNVYRGTQTVPSLLESIHMALESWLLTQVKIWDTKTAEQWCLYLIQKSHSASITAIVVSAVLSESSKLFNVAETLFRNKDFFFFDTSRLQLDMTHAKWVYSMATDPTGIFKNERLQTCEHKHRSYSLEQLAFNYQMFITKGEEEEVVKQRQEAIWKILDEYYANLPDTSTETESDKTWRLCLARMDRRKMKISTEEKEDQVLISLEPEIDPELTQYSEDAQAKYSESTKYLPLQLWTQNRFKKSDEAKKYPQYEDDHNKVLAETKTILEHLKNDKTEDRQFTLFYRSVPPYACAVLIRDYFEKLNLEDLEFCKDVILEYASAPLRREYRYQVGDGLDAAINVLPLLIKRFPKDAERIKETILLLLFDSYPVGMNQRVSDYVVSAILGFLWEESPEDANALFLGYLVLKPKFESVSDSIREENHKKHIYDFSMHEVIDRFKMECANDIQQALSNQLVYDDIPDIVNADLNILVQGFLLIPLRTDDKNHKQFLRDISPALIQALKSNDREEHLDYALQFEFFRWFAEFVLTSKKEDIVLYVQPFVELVGDFRGTENVSKLLNEFIIAEDKLKQYEEFWTVWQVFYSEIVELCNDESRLRYSKSTVYKYLFAIEWKNGIKKWHSIQDRDKKFFKKVAEDMGANSAALYSLAKLLNDVGSSFDSDGISWISGILNKTPDLVYKEQEVNTVYYLENLLRSYILRNRQMIRTDLQLKAQVLVILDFLLEKASVTAYMLREDIL